MDGETRIRLERFVAAGGAAGSADEQRLLDTLLWQSPYLSAFLIRDPLSLARLARDPHLRREKPAALTRGEVTIHSLHGYRNREYLRLGARELGWGAPEEVGRELAHLADACLEVAVAHALEQLTQRHGPPLTDGGARCRFVVLGMGKLGGEELNFSSDIDLLYLYETDAGGCAGGLTLHEFFSRLAERVTRLIGDVTDEGFCFRVDLRLRPEGTRGPLTNSLAAAERYYESWGRPWERQAWLKARPVAGDLDLGWEALRALSPFIWPSTASERDLDSVRELMAKLRAHPDDVKLAPGGIRQIEFFAQALQMVHARLPSLRERGTLRALDKLLFAGLVSDREQRALVEAYVFLRRVEHRLQLDEGLQTHTLPADRHTLALRLGYLDVASFERALGRHRRAVSEIYQTLGAPDEEPEPLPELDPRELDRLRAFAPRLIKEVARSPDPELALRRLVDLRSRKSAGIWQLIEAHRPLGTLLVSLFGTSEFLGKALVAHPELLYELLSASQAEGRASLDERVARALAAGDLEACLNALRRLKNEELLRVGLFDIAGELTPAEVSAQLSDLAEAILNAALALVTPGVYARRGPPVSSLAVLALGKLGGRELSYASDLDLIFVYGDLADFEIFSGVAQKLLHALSAPLDDGRLYPVDTRLRPSGQQGALVSSLAGFRAYHARQSAPWERQALIKLRAVAGDQALGAQVEAEAAAHVWREPGEGLAAEIGRLRARLEKERAHETPRRFNLKSGRGGLLDVEFLVQYLQLRDGRVRERGTAQALAELQRCGILPQEEAALLADSYAFLRRLEDRLRMVHDRPMEELGGDLDKLARRLGYHGEAPGARLLGDYLAHTERVRGVYTRYLPSA